MSGLIVCYTAIRIPYSQCESGDYYNNYQTRKTLESLKAFVIEALINHYMHWAESATFSSNKEFPFPDKKPNILEIGNGKFFGEIPDWNMVSQEIEKLYEISDDEKANPNSLYSLCNDNRFAIARLIPNVNKDGEIFHSSVSFRSGFNECHTLLDYLDADLRRYKTIII